MTARLKMDLVGGAAALACAFSASGAVAQTTEAPRAETGASEADAGKSSDDIVVTANKRSASVSRTPIAITALDGAALEAAGVTELKDIGESVPNVTIRTIGYAGSVQVTIRGITNTSNNPGGQPTVATYFDGVYSPRTQGLIGSLYDLSRVEVLRGPQGTLYGRNSTAGNFNVFTNEPKFDPEGSASLSYGRFNDIQAEAMVNVPISETLAVRFAGSIRKNDGIYNTSGGSVSTDRNYGMADDVSGRLSILWNPSSAFSWRVTVQNDRIRGTPGLDYQVNTSGKTLDGRNPFSNPQVPASPSPYAQIDNLMLRSAMRLDVGGGASLSYTAGYQNLRHFFRASTGGAAVSLADLIRDGQDQNTYHEVNFSFENDKLFNVMGANYFYEEESFFNPAHFNQLRFGYVAGSPAGRRAIGYKTRSWGVFDQLTYNISNEIRAIAGVRFSKERSEGNLNGSIVLICGIGQTYEQLEQSLYNPAHPGCSGAPGGSAEGSWSKTTWRGGLEFDLDSQTLAYGTVSTGFKSGGLNRQLPGIPLEFAPETVTNYELGLKTRLFDQLRLNIAAFYMDYSNLQIVQFVQATGGQPIQTTTNAARARVYGVEMEAQWQISDNDRFAGFFNWLNARYSRYRDTINPYTGTVVASLDDNQLINAPDFSLRGEYTHTFQLANGATIAPGASVYWQSRTYLREFNLPMDRVSAYAKLDGTITFQTADDKWTVQAYIRNATNKLVRNSANVVLPGTYLSTYEQPRTYGVRASYRF
jgi:iron complex outermembrane receptor protein